MIQNLVQYSSIANWVYVRSTWVLKYKSNMLQTMARTLDSCMSPIFLLHEQPSTHEDYRTNESACSKLLETAVLTWQECIEKSSQRKRCPPYAHLWRLSVICYPKVWLHRVYFTLFVPVWHPLEYAATWRKSFLCLNSIHLDLKACCLQPVSGNCADGFQLTTYCHDVICIHSL